MSDWSQRLKYWRASSTVRARWWWHDTVLLARRTIADFADDHCPQLAASISYYVLFSIFPLAILVVGVSGLVLQDDQLRADLIDFLVDKLPLSETQGRSDLEDAFTGLENSFSLAAAIGLAGLLWSATAMMSAIRFGLNQAWDTEYRRPLLLGKLVDILMVLAVGVLLTASMAATIFLQVARRTSEDLSEWLGPLGEGATAGSELLILLLPLLLSFLTFLAVFTLVPSIKTRVRFVWPGALLAAVLFEIVKNGFAFYLQYFGDYDAVYGSLGAALAFLFFVYVSANVMLLGAEMAAEWPRVTHGWYDDQPSAPRSTSRKEAILQGLLSLVRSEAPPPRHISDEHFVERRRARMQREIAAAVGAETPVDRP